MINDSGLLFLGHPVCMSLKRACCNGGVQYTVQLKWSCILGLYWPESTLKAYNIKSLPHSSVCI